MSLILDALKKSEAERQRGQVPNVLSPLPASPSHVPAYKKSRLPWLITLGLLIIALIFGYFYMQDQDADSDSAIIVLAPSAQMPEQAPTEAALVIPEVLKPAQIEKPLTPAATTPAPTPAKPQALPELIEVPPAVADTQTATRIASLSEMSTEQRQQLPVLKLSMHVYSSDAGKRFAIIDGQRVNEGSVLGAAVIEQIRQDGVVLSVQGQSYLLPRP